MNNNLITDYQQFNFNNEFIPSVNIFNVNTDTRVGIGTHNPKEKLQITNSIDIQGNIIISGNLLFNKPTATYDNNFIHILYKNTKDNQINIGKLTYSSPDTKSVNYKWYKNNNNELYINTNDNRPNTKLEFKSSHYSIAQATSYTIDLISHSKVYITHLYIYNTSDKSIITNQTGITVNSISTTYTNNYYRLTNPIVLEANIKTTLQIASLTDSIDKTIQFIGNYDYEAGSFWFNNSSNTYINKDISINSTDNFNKQLYVNGDTEVKNDLIVEGNVNTNTFKNTNTLTVVENLNVNSIQSTTNLIINSSDVSFGKYNNNNLCSIGDYSYITAQGDLYTRDLTVTQNMNTSQIYHTTNNSFIKMDNNINIGYDFYSNSQISSTNYSDAPANPQTLLNINEEKINIYSKTIISDNSNVPSNTNGDSLHIVGNVNIDGFLNTNQLNYTNFTFKSSYDEITCDYIKSTGLTHLGYYTTTPTIQTKSIDTANLYFDSTNENNNVGSIYFNKSTDSFHSKTNVDFKLATSSSSSSSSNTFTYSNNIVYASQTNTNKLISQRIESTYLNTKKVDTTYLKLPYSHTLLNNYIYSDMLGTLQFNKHSNNKYQIHNGTNWNTLLFDTFNDSTKKYKFEVKTTPIITNSQLKQTIPFNFHYNLNIGTTAPTSGSRYTLTQINYPRNDRYLLDTTNQLKVGSNTFIISDAIDNGLNYTCTLTKTEGFNELYVHITETIDTVHTGQFVTNTTLLTNYINNKVFNILSNKLYYNNSGTLIDTNIRIKKKRQIASNKYEAYLVYSNPIMDISTTTAGVTHNSTTNDSTIELKFSSIENTQNFTETDIIKHNCTLSQFTKISPKVYTSTLNPIGIQTSCAIQIPNNVFTNIYGISNIQSKSFIWNSDRRTPFITSISISNDNSTITVTFNETIYNTASGSGSIEAIDFVLSLTGGVATLASNIPTTISSTSGNIYILGINLSGTPNGSETLTVNPANNSIYDLAGNVSAPSQSNNFINLIEKIVPVITGISISNDNSTITVTFNETIYNTATGSGSIEENDFELSLTGGSATLASNIPTTISPSTGNTNEYVLGINISGTANGSETLTVNPKADSIYDLVGNVSSTSQSNNTINLIEKIVPFITSISINNTNTEITVTFNETIYNTSSGYGSIEANDFVLSLTGGSSTLASTTPTSISPASGNTNEYILGINISGTANGLEILTVNPKADSIYDLVGNVSSTSQSNNSISHLPIIITGSPQVLKSYYENNINWTTIPLSNNPPGLNAGYFFPAINNKITAYNYKVIGNDQSTGNGYAVGKIRINNLINKFLLIHLKVKTTNGWYNAYNTHLPQPNASYDGGEALFSLGQPFLQQYNNDWLCGSLVLRAPYLTVQHTISTNCNNKPVSGGLHIGPLNSDYISNQEYDIKIIFKIDEFGRPGHYHMFFDNVWQDGTNIRNLLPSSDFSHAGNDIFKTASSAGDGHPGFQFAIGVGADNDHIRTGNEVTLINIAYQDDSNLNGP